RTIVATPDGTAWANPTGTPVLASAGTRGVLAGLLGALLEARLPADGAAVMAAFTHGLGGRIAAARAGWAANSVTAMEVAGALREAVASLHRPEVLPAS